MTLQEVLLVEIHRMIDESSIQAIQMIGVDFDASELSYPPGISLGEEHIEAIRKLRLNAASKEALRLLIKNACASAVFSFFALCDSVSDPELAEVETWPGVELVEKEMENRRSLLHDAFYESYWRYKALTGEDA